MLGFPKMLYFAHVNIYSIFIKVIKVPNVNKYSDTSINSFGIKKKQKKRIIFRKTLKNFETLNWLCTCSRYIQSIHKLNYSQLFYESIP